MNELESIRTPSFRLDGKVALVTGAGRGIGAAASLALADAGAEVVMIARTESDLVQMRDEISKRGGKSYVIALDVTDTDRLRSQIAQLSRLDILVNNTGTNVAEPFVDVTAERLDSLLALNLKAVFWTAQFSLQKMLENPHRKNIGGSIINVSSQFGHVGGANRAIYSMTKHAIEGLTKSIALEVASHNIRVNSLAPTYVDTPLVQRVVDTPEKRRALAERIPLGRIGNVQEVMGPLLFLASDASSLMTGSHLLLDGGWTAQ